MIPHIARLASLAFILAFPAIAADWGHDDATSTWFRSLHDSRGFPCCDYVDGTRVEDPDDYTRNEDGSYDVRVAGDVIHVPEFKVLQGSNRVGYAILWHHGANAYCFLPGSAI